MIPQITLFLLGECRDFEIVLVYLKQTRQGFQHRYDKKRRITYTITNFNPTHCNRFFMYLQEVEDYVMLQHANEYDAWKEKYESFCYVKDYMGRVEFCEKRQKMWDYAVESVGTQCMAKLCNYAKTGKWKAGLFKQKAAKSMAWKGEMPGHKSYGYKDVFKHKCWHGPETYGDLLDSDFDAFVAHHKKILTTPSGTFDKTVCGCRSADDCTGYYKPEELYHRSG